MTTTNAGEALCGALYLIRGQLGWHDLYRLYDTSRAHRTFVVRYLMAVSGAGHGDRTLDAIVEDVERVGPVVRGWTGMQRVNGMDLGVGSIAVVLMARAGMDVKQMIVRDGTPRVSLCGGLEMDTYFPRLAEGLAVAAITVASRPRSSVASRERFTEYLRLLEEVISSFDGFRGEIIRLLDDALIRLADQSYCREWLLYSSTLLPVCVGGVPVDTIADVRARNFERYIKGARLQHHSDEVSFSIGLHARNVALLEPGTRLKFLTAAIDRERWTLAAELIEGGWLASILRSVRGTTNPRTTVEAIRGMWLQRADDIAKCSPPTLDLDLRRSWERIMKAIGRYDQYILDETRRGHDRPHPAATVHDSLLSLRREIVIPVLSSLYAWCLLDIAIRPAGGPPSFDRAMRFDDLPDSLSLVSDAERQAWVCDGLPGGCEYFLRLVSATKTDEGAISLTHILETSARRWASGAKGEKKRLSPEELIILYTAITALQAHGPSVIPMEGDWHSLLLSVAQLG